jgi:hypothetical protein
MKYEDALKLAEEMSTLGYKKAGDVLRKQAEEIQYLQDQFDRAIDFLAKCNGWSKNERK